MNPFLQSLQDGPGEYMLRPYLFGPLFGLGFFLIMLEIVLKGFALWRAARMEKVGWFIALMLLNTIGILPAIFLLMTKEEYEKLPKNTVTAS